MEKISLFLCPLMAEVKRIFVPVDFSKASVAALQYAVYIANRTNSTIDLVHVALRDKLAGKSNSPAEYKQKLKKLEVKLTELKNKSGAAFRIEEEVITTSESVAEFIEGYGAATHTELACIGTSGAASKKSTTKLGTHTEKLVKTADFPVLTCREVKEPLQFKNLLLPIDLTKYTSIKVERIIRFAKAFESTIHLVAVSEFLEEFISSKEELEKKMDEAAEFIRKNGLKCTTEMIRHDTVSNSVLMYAEEIDADLLVVMGHEENRITQLLFGSRINKVITHSKIPVLSFRFSED